MRNVDELNLSSKQINGKDVENLINELQTQSPESLNLENNFIDDEGVSTLSKAIENTSIKSLNLKNNVISTPGCEAIANSLKNTQLNHLNLENNFLSDQDFETLMSALPECQLMSLKASSLMLHYSFHMPDEKINEFICSSFFISEIAFNSKKITAETAKKHLDKNHTRHQQLQKVRGLNTASFPITNPEALPTPEEALENIINIFEILLCIYQEMALLQKTPGKMLYLEMLLKESALQIPKAQNHLLNIANEMLDQLPDELTKENGVLPKKLEAFLFFALILGVSKNTFKDEYMPVIVQRLLSIQGERSNNNQLFTRTNQKEYQEYLTRTLSEKINATLQTLQFSNPIFDFNENEWADIPNLLSDEKSPSLEEGIESLSKQVCYFLENLTNCAKNALIDIEAIQETEISEKLHSHYSLS